MTHITHSVREDLAVHVAAGDWRAICAEQLGWTQAREASLIRSIRRAAEQGRTVEEVLAEHEAQVAVDDAEFADARRRAHLRRPRNWARCPGCGEVHDIPAGQSRCRECGPADDAPIVRPLVAGVTR
ncbi:hypothetical protein ACFRCG_47950 [Embleya sp. NPDC056575]|uniref:hypothetical protein n=1 Tax=unclassified Embleya TaxID=2699296 RepID=UPI0036C7601E